MQQGVEALVQLRVYLRVRGRVQHHLLTERRFSKRRRTRFRPTLSALRLRDGERKSIARVQGDLHEQPRATAGLDRVVGAIRFAERVQAVDLRDQQARPAHGVRLGERKVRGTGRGDEVAEQVGRAAARAERSEDADVVLPQVPLGAPERVQLDERRAERVRRLRV